MLFEELKEGRAFPRIETPTFLDDESRNAETKAIEVGHLGSLRDPSAGTIQRLISRSRGIGDAASSKIALQLLMKTKVAATCLICIVRAKKRQ